MFNELACWFCDLDHQLLFFGFSPTILTLIIGIKYNWDHDFPEAVFEFKKKRRQEKVNHQFLKKRSEESSLIRISPSLLRIKSK